MASELIAIPEQNAYTLGLYREVLRHRRLQNPQSHKKPHHLFMQSVHFGTSLFHRGRTILYKHY